MKKQLGKGVYIVVNPAVKAEHIYRQLSLLNPEKMAAVQIWDNPGCERVAPELIVKIINIFKNTKVPVLMNNRRHLLDDYDFDGIHYDVLPSDFGEESKALIKGLTLGNNLQQVQEAEQKGCDYFSFCSIFPSKTSNSCEIIKPESLVSCRQLTGLPLYVAGGINITNIQTLKNLPIDGVAVVSAIMEAQYPDRVLEKYYSILFN